MLQHVTTPGGPARPPRGIDSLREEIGAHRASQARPSWDALGRFYGVNKAVLWRIHHGGYEPKDQEIRRRLGLPLTLDPSYTTCRCGTRYVPNVPWRKSCYLCSPPRN